MLNGYPWGTTVKVVRPLGPLRLRVSFLSYVRDPSRLDRGAGTALDRVEREDEVIVESIQAGTLCRRGHTSPPREQGVRPFSSPIGEIPDLS
ncbi:MAG: hypothetical protein AAF604_03335 [Acidobacteriota bacterium]